MRTTISLSDGLAADVKRRAAEAGMSVSAFIEALIRAALHEREKEAKPKRFKLITAGDAGATSRTPLDRSAKLAEDEDERGSLVKAGR